MVNNFIRSIDLITNYSCNMKCRMCDGWKIESPKNPPKLIDYEKAFANLKKWLGNDFKIQIAGGEPLLNPNTIDIIKLASNKGITISMITNGSLINEEVAMNIINSGINCITISLDSINPSIHDYMRGVERTHAKAITAIRYLKKVRHKRQFIVIASIISKYNKDELIPLIKWAKKEKLNNIIFQAINDTFFGCRADGYDKNIWPQNDKEIQELVNVVEDIKKMKSVKEYESFIINPINLLTDIQDYLLRGHWLKNG